MRAGMDPELGGILDRADELAAEAADAKDAAEEAKFEARKDGER